MRFTIDLAEESAGPDSWSAAVFEIDEDGDFSDALACGAGSTPQHALSDLLSDWIRSED